MTSALEAKFGVSSPNKRKKLEEFWYHKRQKLGNNHSKENLILFV